MQARILFRYLTGRRGAILALATSRAALGIGFLFVLSAGLAREYDGDDLWRRPAMLLVPFVSSLVVAFALYALACAIARPTGLGNRGFLAGFRSFLALFWMTAPLAWLYAVPYERFLAAGDAVRANLWTLAFVSVWRVALMTRVLTVLFNFHGLLAFFTVLTCSDLIAMTLMFTLPVPLIDVMGGVRLSEADRILRTTANNVSGLGLCTLPLWGIGLLVTAHLRQREPESPEDSNALAVPPSRSLLALAVCSVVFGLALLPLTQPEQQRRYRVEQDFRAGRIAEAVAYLSAHDQAEFPPHWNPPPRYVSLYHEGSAESVLDAWDTIDDNTPAWVRVVYLRKFGDLLSTEFHYRQDLYPRMGALLNRLREGPDLAAQFCQEDGKLGDLKPYLTDPRFAPLLEDKPVRATSPMWKAD